jgi:hypothetical protein
VLRSDDTRRAHDALRDGKALASSIDLRSERRLLIKPAFSFLLGSLPTATRCPLPFGIKKLGKEIKINVSDAATGFLTLVAWGMDADRLRTGFDDGAES